MRTDKIVVCFVNPPIPIRTCDWIAHYDRDEPDDDGRMLCGFGRTPEEAVKDLRISEEAQ